MQLNVNLTPIFEHDADTDRFMAHFKEFPQAFAIGETKDEAEQKLIPLVELMWLEKPKDLERILLERYINDSHRKNPEIIKE